MTDYTLADAAPGAVRVTLQGRLDSAGVEQVEVPLTAALRDGTGHVLLDLGKVGFVGSLGIRLLIALGRTLHKQRRGLALFAVQPQVAEVFETVALSDLIPIAGTEEDALAELADSNR